MKFTHINGHRWVGGLCAGCLLGGLAAATMAAPTASAAPDCSPGGVRNTVSSSMGAVRQYLNGHPDANQVVMAAANEPSDQAETDVRNYFTAHPQEYSDLRGIMAPIGDTQRQCNVTVVPSAYQWAYDEFMAG
jgi:heme-binding protein